jgi:hypothetical protein
MIIKIKKIRECKLAASALHHVNVVNLGLYLCCFYQPLIEKWFQRKR